MFTLKANRNRKKMHLWYRIEQKRKSCHEEGSKGNSRFAKVWLFIGPQGLAAPAEMLPKGVDNAKHSLP